MENGTPDAIGRLRALPFARRLAIVLAVVAVAAVVTLSVPPFAQPLWYHDFADKRFFCGVPNFANVASNAGFALAGLAGLAIVRRLPADGAAARPPYLVLALGLIGVAFGSAYYHWAPDTTTLYWDRLPMTVAFMALLSALVADRIDRRAGLALLPLLVAAGIAAVTWWRQSELAGAGDLRPYFLVQIVPALSLPLIVALFADRIGGDHDLVLLAALYALALVLENTDWVVLGASGGLVSGHSLKHLAAALAAYMAFHRLGRLLPDA